MHPIARTALAAALTVAAVGAQAVTLVGITSERNLVRIDTSKVAAATSVAITGMAVGEMLIGIDTRPSNGKLYGITTASKLYTLDERTGAATFVAGLTGATINKELGYGIDFNPLADFNGAASFRLVSSAGDNYAVNANTGAVAVQTSIVSGNSGVAYTNSVLKPTAAPAAPTLYYINSGTDTLSKATGRFNNPDLLPVGNLGVDVLKANGFEITGTGQAFAALTVDASTLSTGIYGIDLTSGKATLLGNYSGTLSGLTVSAVPEPESYALMLAGLLAVGTMARRRSKAAR